jgi:hypothetical protein
MAIMTRSLIDTSPKPLMKAANVGRWEDEASLCPRTIAS